MKPFALSITHSLGILLCYLSLAAHLTSAIWIYSDRPKSRNKVSVAATARGTKQNVGLIDEAMKVLGLDEFFGIYDTDNDDDADESDEYEVKHSNTKRHSDDSKKEYSTRIKHKDRKSNNKNTRNNSSKNNNKSKGEQDKQASSFYSDIESALEQATDKAESLWLQFKQGIHSLMPDLSHHENGNESEVQIKPIQTKPITILAITKAIETTTERPITRSKIEISSEEVTTMTTEKLPIARKILENSTDNPLTNGTTESSNAPSKETTTEKSKMETPPSSENLDS